MKLIKWTAHAKYKMRQYSLSEARVLRVLYNHIREEEGIAPKTIAVMSPTMLSLDKKKWKQEIWVMYQDTKKFRKIIVAWRYPGISPVRQPPPFPKDLL